MKKESLAIKIINYINEEKKFTLQELYDAFGEKSKLGYKNHSVRARLYESDAYQEKQLIKTSTGVYVLSGIDIEAIVEQVDTRNHIYQLTDAKLTYDLCIIDSPYKTSAQKGGNRQLTDFEFISPSEFSDIIIEVEKLMKNKYSQLIMMISGGKSGKRDVDKYLKMFDNTNFKLSNRGSYTKYNKNGSVCNIGKYSMPPEQILSFSLSGEERKDTDTSPSTKYHFVRPSLPRSGGYSTQKPEGLLEKIITRSTNPGDKILDIFAGSGVSLKVGLQLGRKVHGLEISETAINNYILPMLNEFTFSSNNLSHF